jgi:hypothetical protein
MATNATTTLAPVSPVTPAPEKRVEVEFWGEYYTATIEGGKVVHVLSPEGDDINLHLNAGFCKLAFEAAEVVGELPPEEEETEEEYQEAEDRYLDSLYEDRHDTDCHW